MTDPPAAPDVRPHREMGRWALAAVGISGVIGAGIFTLPATLAAMLGAASLPAYLVAAGATMLFGRSMAILGRSFDLTGGPYMYVVASLGRFWGFQVGWFFVLARLTALGAVTNVFVSYFSRFVPAAGSGAGRAAAIILSLGVLAALNITGIRGTSKVMNGFAIAKVVPLALFVAAGAWFGDASRLAIHTMPDPSTAGRAVLLLIFAFGGFEFLTVPAEESRRPAEHVPFALMVTIATCTLLFAGVQAVALAVAPDLGRHPDALSYAAEIFAGRAGALAMAAAAIAATTGTNLANLFVSSRMLYAFSRDGLLPARIGQLDPRFRTPMLAIVLNAGIGIALALSGSFVWLAALSAAARLVVYGSCCAAVVRLRHDRRGALGRKPASVSAPVWRGGGAWLDATGAAAAMALIAMLSWRDLAIAAGAAIAGALIFLTTARAESPRSEGYN